MGIKKIVSKARSLVTYHPYLFTASATTALSCLVDFSSDKIDFLSNPEQLLVFGGSNLLLALVAYNRIKNKGMEPLPGPEDKLLAPINKTAKFFRKHNYIPTSLVTALLLASNYSAEGGLATSSLPEQVGIATYFYSAISQGCSLCASLIDILTMDRNKSTISLGIKIIMKGDKEAIEQLKEKRPDMSESEILHFESLIARIEGRMDDSYAIYEQLQQVKPSRRFSQLENPLTSGLYDLVALVQSTFALKPKETAISILTRPRIPFSSKGSPIQLIGDVIFRDNLDYNLLKALGLQRFGNEKKKHKQWASTLSLVLSHPEEYTEERIGESRREVKVVGSPFFKGKAISIFDSLEDLVKTVELRDEQQDLLTEGRMYRVLSPPAEYSINGEKQSIFMMYREPGEVMWDAIRKDGASPHMEKIRQGARMLAMIHAGMPFSSSDIGIVDLSEKTHNRLHESNMAKSLKREMNGKDYEKLTKDFEQGHEVMMDAFESQPLGFYWDHHPQQLLFSDDTIRLDSEDNGIMPIALDMVNYLEYGPPLFSHEQKAVIIQDYLDTYNSLSGKSIQMPDFMFVYHHATVQRSLSLTSAWSNPGRGSMRQLRIPQVDKALNALIELERDYPDKYSNSIGSYLMIKQSLTTLRTVLGKI